MNRKKLTKLSDWWHKTGSFKLWCLLHPIKARKPIHIGETEVTWGGVPIEGIEEVTVEHGS